MKAALKGGAVSLRNRVWEDFDRDFSALTKNQKAVLAQLIHKGEEFSPFTEESLNAYVKFTGDKIDSAAAQAALNALREKNFVWRSARGAYALEDQSMAEWFISRLEQSTAAQK